MKKLILAVLAVTTFTGAVIDTALAQSQCRVRCGYNSNSGENCSDQLGFMKRVYPAEVLGIDNSDRVWITEFCPGSSVLRSEGNAAYLRTTIAANDVLVEKLLEKGYRAEDVIAVRMMGDDTINLYVHVDGGNGGRSLTSIL
jgi:hypothetical protein